MIVNVFGPLSVMNADGNLRGSAFGGAQARATLEILLLARGNTVTKEQLADAVWGDAPPKNINSAVEQAICTLRRRLFVCAINARNVLQTEPNAYRIDTNLMDFDLDRFDRAWQLAATSDGDKKYEALAQAAACAHQELLADSPYAEWASESRERYRLQAARAHLKLAAWNLMHRRPESALHNCEHAVRHVPLSEEAHRLALVADTLLGHSDMARYSHQRFAATLHTSLGVAPSSETIAIYDAINQGTPAAELLQLACPNTPQPPIRATP